MRQRLADELEMIRIRYPAAIHAPDGDWVLIPALVLPVGWNREATDVAFQVPDAYPGTPPYGIYVLSGLRFKEAVPDNYSEPAPTRPPFEGDWAVFSWAPEDGSWRATADPRTGSNLINWIAGFSDRFRGGK